MGSGPYINISLLLIIASMAMLASSNTIQPETTYDFPTCLEAIKGCFYEIHQFKEGLVSGVLPEPGSGLIGPACCAAIIDIHDKCWLFILPDPFFTPQLQNYCTRQSQMPPPPGNPDTPLAPAAAPDPDTHSPAPQVDPSPAPAPSQAPEVDPSPAPAPSQAPEVDLSPTPAPQAPAPAPQVDPPAPAPQAPAPAPQVDPPAPAPQTPSQAPAPHRRHCHPHRQHGGSLGEKWFCT